MGVSGASRTRDEETRGEAGRSRIPPRSREETMSGRQIAFALALYSAPVLSGCAMAPRYDARVIEAHKDAIVLLVYVTERLDPDSYRRIAEAEIRNALATRTGSVPLYEVQVEFLVPPDEKGQETKLASFSWKSGSGSVDRNDTVEHALVLY